MKICILSYMIYYECYDGNDANDYNNNHYSSRNDMDGRTTIMITFLKKYNGNHEENTIIDHNGKDNNNVNSQQEQQI